MPQAAQRLRDWLWTQIKVRVSCLAVKSLLKNPEGLTLG
jgi:hypothetical protein